MFFFNRNSLKKQASVRPEAFREIDSENFLNNLRSGNGKKSQTFKKFVTVTHKPLLNYVRKFIRSEELAHKLVQEVFVDLYQGLAEFKGNCSLTSWAFMLTNNRINARLSDSVPAEQAPFQEGEGNGGELTGLAEDLPFSLKPAYLLHDVQGLTLGEVSTILDMPESTVRNRVHWARHQIVSQSKSRQ